MKTIHAFAALCALVGAGCADGTSTLSLHVGATSTVANVDHLSFTFTNVARGKTSSPVVVAWPDGSIPPERDLSFSFPSSVKGTVHVNAQAIDAGGAVLVTGDADVSVTPSHAGTGVMTLGAHTGGVLPDAMLSTVTVDRAGGVAANGADASTVTVTLKDSAGAPLPGLNVDLSASGTGGAFTMPNPTDDQGVTTSAFSSTVAETKTITASVNGLTLQQMPTVTFVSGGSVASLKFAMQPQDGVTQLPLPTFTVAVVDAQGAVITSAANPITVTLQTNPGGANLLGSATVNAVSGVATFNVVGLDQPASGYKLSAAATGLTSATSSVFNVTPVPFRPVSTGVFGGQVFSLAIAPAVGGQPVTIYAGTGIGVFKSTNSAGTWTSASFGLDAPAGRVVVDPKTPTNVYVSPSFGSGSTAGPDYFVKKSTDAGASWLDLSTQPMNVQVGALVIDPNNPAILYAGNPTGIYKTTTGGASWTKTSFPYNCYALSIDPVTPTTIYALGYDATGGAYKGVLKSIDSGANWTAVNTGLASVSAGYVIATPTGVFTAAGNATYRSTDGGANWSNLGVGNSTWAAYAPSNPMIVYLAQVASGIAASTNGGASFGTPVSVGSIVNTVVVDPANANQAYAGADGGVFATSNGGGAWNPASIGITALQINAAAMAPSIPNTVLVGSGKTIYRTTDGGTTWSTRNVSDTVWSLQFDPATSTTAYACSLGGTFYVSTDSGNTWSAGVSTGGSPYCYYIDVHGSTIYVATVGGVRKSTNGGTTWAGTGLTAPTYAVASDATTATVVAGTNAGIQRSTNGGTTWAVITADIATGLIADPMTATILHAGLQCAGSSNGGFLKSTDFGVTFGAAMPGLCVNRMSTNGSYIYAATRSGAPYAVSPDHGVTWGYGGTGIPSTVEGEAIAASADNLVLYVGTLGGLYKSTTGGQ